MQNTINIINGKCMYRIGCKEFEITGKIKLLNESGEPTGEAIPIVDIPQMSDYKYQLMTLNDRIEHPERYEANENVLEVMDKIKRWLLERTTEALRLQFQRKYKCCFDFMMQGS